MAKSVMYDFIYFEEAYIILVKSLILFKVFHMFLFRDYASFGKSPLVFIVTDTKTRKLDISYNLFGDAVLESHKISKIW